MSMNSMIAAALGVLGVAAVSVLAFASPGPRTPTGAGCPTGCACCPCCVGGSCDCGSCDCCKGGCCCGGCCKAEGGAAPTDAR